jgi:hypothetical protein
MRVGSPGWRLLTTGYALLAIAGFAAMVWPSPAVTASSGRLWASVWACLLIVGGSTAAYGAARKLYRWEYVGLPALISVWIVYALASFSLVATGLLDRLAGGCALLAVAALLAARWRDVSTVRRAAREVSEHGSKRRERRG